MSDYFVQNNITHIDYKDLKHIKQFINPHGRILSRKRTGLTAKNQRALAQAIKRARFMGFIPFIAR